MRGPLIPLRTLLLGIALFLVYGLQAAAASPDWTGAWDSRWFDGGARVYMQQTDDQVTGRYPAYKGKLEGEVDGNRLTGTWSTPKASGSFEFVLSDDGKSFIGRLGNKQWWTGSRIRPNHDQALRAFQSSPAETLRTFLIAAEAVQSGRLEYQDDLLSLLIFPGGGRENHGRELAPLALLLDQFTVDPAIFETAPPEGSEAEITLTRYDGKTLTLQFRKPNDDWFMVAPPIEEVKALLAEISAQTPAIVHSGSTQFDGSTPRAAMESFIDAMRAGPAMQDTAIAALDLSELPPVVRDRQAVLVAEYLNEVIARIGEVVFQEIPNDPSSREPFIYFVHPAGDIVLAPTETEDGVMWKFTPETVRSIRSLYGETENLPQATRVLPYDAQSQAPYFRIRAWIAGLSTTWLQPIGPLEAWQWASLLCLIAVGVIASVLTGIVLMLGQRLLRRGNEISNSAYFAIWGIRLLVFGIINYIGFAVLGLPSGFGSTIKSFAVLLMIVGSIPFSFWLVDRFRKIVSNAGLITPRGEFLATLLVGMIKVLIICASVLMFAEALRIPYGAAVAGLGISGIAIAFAARSTLENVISAVILFIDRPVDVNDFGRYNGRIGSIEHIGLRATVVRTLERTLITIPNSDFMSSDIENFTRRDSVLMRRTFALRPETSLDQLRFVLTEIRRLLIGHPKVLKDPARVRLLGVADNRVEYEIFAYIKTVDYSEFLAIQEDIIFRMMDVIEKAGTDFASPARTLYMARDRGMDADKGTEAAEKVAGWRETGELPFPNLTDAEVRTLQDTLDFPPEGAPPEDQQFRPASPSTSPARSRRFRFFGLGRN